MIQTCGETRNLARCKEFVIEAIHNVGRARHFDLIAGDGTLFASHRIDITNLVVDRLKEQYRLSKTNLGVTAPGDRDR